MGFFENIGKKIGDVGEKAVEKTKQYTDISSTSYKIKDSEKELKELYAKIGEMYVDKYAENPDEDLKEQVDAINELKAKIAELKDHLDDVKAAKDGNKRCAHCGEVIPMDAKFCTKCGEEAVEVDEVGNEVEESTDVKECPECHAVIKDNADTCPACGASVNE